MSRPCPCAAGANDGACGHALPQLFPIRKHMVPPTSSRRFADYRRQLRTRPAGPQPENGSEGKPPPPRSRSFGQLFLAFLGLLKGHRAAIAFALATLSLATVLHLAPPLATKLVIDNVLTDRPLPAWWTQWLHLPT